MKEERFGFFPRRIPAAVFVVPVLIFAAVWILAGLAPFGASSLLPAEEYYQFAADFSRYRQICLGGGDFLYDFTSAMGDGASLYWGIQFYSPINLLLLIFPAGAILWGLWVVCALRLVLASAGFYRLSARFCRDGRLALGGALMYVSAGLVPAFYFQTMWLDLLWILPLMMDGLFRCFEGKSGKLLGLAVFFMLFCCPLAGILYLPAGILCGVLLHIPSKGEEKSFWQGISKCFLSVIVGAGLSTVCWLPLIVRMVSHGAFSWGFGLLGEGEFSGALPVIFEGVFLLAGMLRLAFSKEISLEKKLCAAGVLAVLAGLFFVRAEVSCCGNIRPEMGWGVFTICILSLLAVYALDKKPLFGKAPAAVCGALALVVEGIAAVIFYGKLPLWQWIVFLVIGVMFALLTAVSYLDLQKLRRVSGKAVWALLTASSLFWGISCAFGGDALPVVFPEDFSDKYAAVQRIFEEDRTFFRMEMTDKSIPGEARLYSYAGTTGREGDSSLKFTPSPAKDSLTGVKYLIAPAGQEVTGYKEWFTKGEQTVWMNPFVLPMGFLAKNNILRASLDEDDPFVSVNRLYLAASGLRRTVFDPMKAPSIQRNGRVSEADGEYHLEASEEIPSPWVEFTYTARKDGAGFLYLPGADPALITLTLNGAEIPFEKNSIISLQNHSAGEQLHIRVCLKGESAFFKTPKAVCENLGALQEYTVLLRSYSCELIRKSDSYVVGFCDVPAGGRYMFTTIPFDTEWKVLVDGEPAEAVLASGDYLAVFLEEGVHTVTLRYFPQIYKTGIGISFSTLILLGFSFWLKRRMGLPEDEKKEHQAPKKEAELSHNH